MTFSIDLWKQKASEKLDGLGDCLERRKTQDTPYLLYGALCGLALSPLVEAAQKGELLPVMTALATVAGGVGGNLIAEQVQRWKNRADEAEIATWVAEHAPVNPDLRGALDAILDQLDAVSRAQAALSPADRQWFAGMLRGELSQLGNLARFQATLTGDGAIAQDHGVAAGSGGVVVGGDVHGDIVTGPKTALFDQRDQQVGTQINVAGNYVAGPPAASPTPPAPDISEGWNSEAIRELLTAAFNDGELTNLCFDHFRPVYEEFSAGMSKGDKIQCLLDQCLRQDQVERLLAQVRKRNPAQYARFAGRLGP